MDESKKKEFDELGFSELMKRPKPELCDYIVEIRQPAVVILPRHELRHYDSFDVSSPESTDQEYERPTIDISNDSLSYNQDLDVVDKEESAEHTKKRRGRKKKNG